MGGDGVGIFRGKGVFLAPPISFAGVVHELGHNFGLPHNATWKAWDGSINGAGTAMTYADPCDPMGGGGDDVRRQFSIRSRVLLGWWGPGDFTEVKHSGVYQIYACDMPGAPGSRGLRIRGDDGQIYWVEFRQLISENPYLMNGVRILKCNADESGKADMTLSLLDMTPGSAAGGTDAPLLLGRTFSDEGAGFQITPVAKKGTTPESLDVVVNLGRHAGNHPPELRLTASTRTPGVGETVTLKAMANDADDDSLQYSWDFGDGSFAWGKPEVAHDWKAGDRDFVVRCSVTDMKGGSASKLLLVTLGHPARCRVAGVLTDEGKPLANVLVKADSTHTTFTDSDGSFALTDLKAGKYRITAHAAGCWVPPVSVECPGPDNIRLTAVPLNPDTIWSKTGIQLQEDDVLQTPDHFRPPVEITIVAKTSATNLRIGYAADQVIFNWEVNGSELRVDGGPANGQHRPNMGAIPRNTYVTIRWVVTPKSQSIFVNGDLRFRHTGDYSHIDRPVSVFTHQSTVTVKSIRVTRLPTGTE